MSVNYNNTNTTNETQDERYNRILRRWFELNSPNGIEDMNQLSDRERRVWIEEIQYLSKALIELCKYINPREIDEVIIIILRGYYGGFIPHNVRKVYNICKENERRIKSVIGYYLRFHNYSESRKINDILKRESRYNSRHRTRLHHYHRYRSDSCRFDGNTTDNSSYTTVDQISNHGSVIYNNNQSSNSCLNQNSTVNSDKMLDDYMNQKQSSNNNFKSMLDNCFKETEYIKPETETLIFNEAIHSEPVQPIVNQPLRQEPIQLEPLQQEPIRQIQFQQEQIPNMELEEGEIDLNVPEINNLNETNVNQISTMASNPVSTIPQTQVTPINNVVGSNQITSTVNSLVQNVIPQSLQNVHNTANTEIDNLNRVRNEINAYIDEVIAKLKGFQSSN